MPLIAEGFELECVELYPMVDDRDSLIEITICCIARGGKCCRVDRVHRRDHQTRLGLLQEVAGMVSHITRESR